MTEQIKKIVDNDEKMVKEFIANSTNEVHQKEEVNEMCSLVENKIAELNSKMDNLENAINGWDDVNNLLADEQPPYYTEYGTKDNAVAQYKLIEKEHDQWASYLSQLQEMNSEHKNFDKMLCFSNIRELLRKNPEVKIGQIEKEAGIRLGYMARLEKEDNTAEPSMEFILTAAKLLKVSVDVLVTVDLKGLTPTEEYLAGFFDKLKEDTLQDKLEWNIETAFDLNKGCKEVWETHPLFSYETFLEQVDSEIYPTEVSELVFNSKNFGPHTYICGDCFNLRLKNGIKLYLMDIEKRVHRSGDSDAFAKEAWMCVPGKEAQALVTTRDNTPVALLLEKLFSTVKERMEHPRVNDDLKYAIDSFMNDDINDDVEEVSELPFY